MMPENPSEQEVKENKLNKFLSNKKNRYFLFGILILVILIPVVFFIFSNLGRQTVVEKNPIFYPNAPYVANKLIVKYKDSYTEDEINNLKGKLDNIGIESQEPLFDSKNDKNLSNFYVLTFKKGVDVKKVAKDLANTPEIEAVGADYIFKNQQTVPNDPYFNQQWDMVKIGMPQAWSLTKGSNSVVAAVVDTGIDYNHPDFVGRTIIKGKDFSTCNQYIDNGDTVTCASVKSPDDDPMDDHSHGTHIAGTIGAMTNNGVGVAGMNWNVTLMAVKAMNAQGEGEVTDIMKAMKYAADNGANIINLSLIAPVPCGDPTVVGYQDTIDYVVSKNVYVVAAAGNSNQDVATTAPPSCNNVTVVGSVDPNDQKASDSNWGSKVDIAAPGVSIYSTLPNGGYGYKSGTSMAAPHVVGAVALLMGINPGLSLSQIKNCLIQNADPISTNKPIGPRLNVFRTINACSGLAPVNEPTKTPTAAPNNPTPTPKIIPVSPVATSAPGQTNQYNIRGSIFVDSNGNGSRDSGEAGFTNADIVTEGVANLQTRPDANGNFSFNNVAQGNYSVSAIVNGVKLMTTNNYNLSGSTVELDVLFPIPPQVLTPTPTRAPGVTNAPNPSPTAIVVRPTVAKKSTAATPTPIKTYSCHEAAGTKVPKNAITIGSLVCTPNN
ncbi:MAG TPA: S8 family serine peptidase [Patescibacteria group bacterium]|nr:S8 family serine peptidase [Patescibacteria group bacterium]